MSEELYSLLKEYWLPVAILLFALIVFQTYRPSMRREMERAARIPFEDDKHG